MAMDAPLRAFIEGTPSVGAPGSGKTIVRFLAGKAWLYCSEEAWLASAKQIFAKILGEPSWAKRVCSLGKANALASFAESRKLLETDFASLSNERLYEVFASFNSANHAAQEMGLPWYVLDARHELYSNYLLDYVKRRIDEKNLQASHDAKEVLAVLTTPIEKSFLKKEEEGFLEILSEIYFDLEARALFERETPEVKRELARVEPSLLKKIWAHFEAYRWLEYNYEGPAWEIDYFIERWNAAARQRVDAASLLKSVREQRTAIAEKQARYIAELGIDAEHKELLELGREMVFLKGYRKDAAYYACYCAEGLLREIGARAGLTLRQTRYLFPEEVARALDGAFTPQEIDGRIKESVVVCEPSGLKKFFYGSETAEIMKLLPKEEKIAGVDELRGTCACPGRGRGTVKIINERGDVSKMRQGDVLVSPMTTPELVSAMRRASAIVTDTGGITCHAAILSRELGIPCVIGTNHATRVFKDGDVVDVDATRGIVKLIKRA